MTRGEAAVRVDAQRPIGLLEEDPMKWLVTLIIACSLIVPFGTLLADQSTAPGQQKKAAGDGSAKEYAPGQEGSSDSESEAKESKKSQAKAKAGKAKADSEEAVPDAPTGKAKAK
jgi:hypothetical protein